MVYPGEDQQRRATDQCTGVCYSLILNLFKATSNMYRLHLYYSPVSGNDSKCFQKLPKHQRKQHNTGMDTN